MRGKLLGVAFAALAAGALAFTGIASAQDKRSRSAYPFQLPTMAGLLVWSIMPNAWPSF